MTVLRKRDAFLHKIRCAQHFFLFGRLHGCMNFCANRGLPA
eukprot:COSAG05_NODE_9809_length_599_cov_1.344000_2_plen_40_part_01